MCIVENYMSESRRGHAQIQMDNEVVLVFIFMGKTQFAYCDVLE